MIQLLGALPGAGFSTNAMTLPSAWVGTTPNALGSSTWVSEIVASAPFSSWNRTIASRSRPVSTSPLHTMIRSSMPFGREADGARGAERFVLDRVAQHDVAELVVAVAVGLEVPVERVGEISHRQHDLVDAVRGEPGELAFEVRLVRDRQQRLRSRERQRPQPRAFAADEDDGFHGFEVGVAAVVGLVTGAVVPLAGAAVVAVAGRVVPVTGAVVPVAGAAVVAVAATPPFSTPSAVARFGTDGGLPMLASVLPSGRKAITTMSYWSSLYLAGFPVLTV